MPPSKCPALLLLCLVGAAAHAQAGGDLQAQIVYAFHAEDANQLAATVQTLSTQVQAGADAALRYHLAHAEYRLGLLSVSAHRHDAERAFSGCIDQLAAIPPGNAQAADTLALQSACYSSLARLRVVERLFLRTRATERLDEAFALAPHNPRVLLIQALQGLADSKAGTAAHAQAMAELQAAVALFEQTSSTGDETPGWGHADAYLELGRQLQARGDYLGARNWLEKSLLAAPDYKAAQRQLASLNHH